MGTSVSISEHKNKYIIFLNISFLFVGLVSLVLYFNSTEFLFLSSNSLNGSTDQDCKDLHKLEDHKAKCFYLKSKSPCVSQGYIDYLSLFYCNFGRFPFLGHFLLFLWLLVLFYLSGNTASEYFCYSLESLSSLLKLSPTIAGVTLLSLGNGASDVFANLVSFMGGGIREIGLNAVLGGASFVTCVVVGTVSIFMHQKRVFVNKPAFIRDLCFLLFVLVSLALILIQEEINLWSAIGFSSMYIVYVIIVYITHLGWTAGNKVTKIDDNSIYGSDLSLPILNEREKADDESKEEVKKCCFCLRSSPSWTMMLWILEMPFYLPRRLTIPVVCEKRWSKPIAVASVTLAPIFLSALWNLQDEDLTSRASLLVYGIGLFFGVTFGVLAFMATEKSSPPKKCLISWLAGGFLMSVIWTYITAQELVALLMSLQYIYGISSSILGLTVLAWGNSFGDLITNLTMALNGGPEGAQVALSGCYAGPIFNTLFGLGLSLVGSSWYAYPSPVLIPENPYLLETLGLLVAGLIWALVVLPMRDMRLDMVLGGGLIIIYLMSISLRLSQTTLSPKLSL